MTVPDPASRLLCGDKPHTAANALEGLCEFVAENLRAVVHFEPAFLPLVGSGFSVQPVWSGCRRVSSGGAE